MRCPREVLSSYAPVYLFLGQRHLFYLYLRIHRRGGSLSMGSIIESFYANHETLFPQRISVYL